MDYVEVAVTVRPQDADAVADRLVVAGFPGLVLGEFGPDGGAALTEATLKIYLPDVQAAERMDAVEEALTGIPFRLAHRVVREEDWAESWKQYWHVQHVGARIVIRPSWEEYDPAPGEVVIVLDPKQAFGTGTHGTTRLCLQAIERLVFFYFPRICKHCLNPACVAACPSGALYKRGEDGIVLVDQKRCRAWRACIAACPYKKTFYNWHTGKSEKCILCFPRLETGQAPACFHSCVGRIRYLGVLLYAAERLESVAKLPDEQLVEAHRSLILDPHDPEVIAGARRNGIVDEVIESAQRSPVYSFVKVWKIALPPHIEFRTLPMLFYVPPMSPVMASQEGKTVEHVSGDLFHDIDEARVPMQFLANLFGAGHEGKVRYALRKQKAVRWWRRALTVGDVDRATAERMLREADCSPEEAEAIYRLTSLCTFEDRFVIPPMHREEAIAMLEDPLEHKQGAGFGFLAGPRRGL